jgi:AcrR family transcriptional regulator
MQPLPLAQARRRRPARQLLLSAAARVFARDGLEGATTKAIAREAGVNEVTLFRHFGTKEHLIEAVVGSAFGGEPKPRRPAPGGTSDRPLREDLDTFARDYEQLLVENLPLVRTMIGEIHRHALCQQQALQGIFSPMRAALVARLARACANGEARCDLDPEISADVLAGSVFAAVLRRACSPNGRRYSASTYRRACVTLFAEGIGAR